MKWVKYIVFGLLVILSIRLFQFMLTNKGDSDSAFIIELVAIALVYIYLGLKHNIKNIVYYTLAILATVIIYLVIESTIQIPSRWFTFVDHSKFGGLYYIGYTMIILGDWIYILLCSIITIILKFIYIKLKKKCKECTKDGD